MKTSIQPQIPVAHLFTASDSAGSMLIRLSGGLALVLVLILVIAWLTRRSGWGSSLAKDKQILRVKHTYSLGQRERIVIVEADDRLLLIGVTPGAVTFLTEMDKKTCSEDAIAARAAGNFQQTFMKALGKTQGTES